MPIWGRLKHELDRASRVAQGAIDEGRLRLEMFRARQRADRAAQLLGYAVHRSRKDGRELTDDDYERSSGEITRAEAEIARLEEQLAAVGRRTATDTGVTTTTPTPP